MKQTSPKNLVLPVAFALALSVGVASAQTNNAAGTSGAPATPQPGASSASNSAVDPSNTASRQKLVASSALQQGANSFTEGEAKSRLESAGLSDINGLKKDNAGDLAR